MATPMSGDFATQAAASSSAKGPIRLMSAWYAGERESGTRSSFAVSAGGDQLWSVIHPVPLHEHAVGDPFQSGLHLHPVGASLERRRCGQLVDDAADDDGRYGVDLFDAVLGEPQSAACAQRQPVADDAV